MFGRIFGPDNPPAAQKTERLSKTRRPVRRKPSGGSSGVSRPCRRSAPACRVRGLHPGACGACRPRHHRRGDAADRAAAPGAGHARRTDRGARGRDGAAQARTVGDTEDYVVTREFKAITTHDQRKAMLRACFAIGAENGSSRPRKPRSSTRSRASWTSTRTPSTRSAPNTTSCCRRCRPCAGSPTARPRRKPGRVARPCLRRARTGGSGRSWVVHGVTCANHDPIAGKPVGPVSRSNWGISSAALSPGAARTWICRSRWYRRRSPPARRSPTGHASWRSTTPSPSRRRTSASSSES